jgi:hypothetical protein
MSRTVTIYCLDVSEGMTEKVLDPNTEEEVQKIDLAKEYIQRKISPKVSHGILVDPGQVRLTQSYFYVDFSDPVGTQDGICRCDHLWWTYVISYPIVSVKNDLTFYTLFHSYEQPVLCRRYYITSRG